MHIECIIMLFRAPDSTRRLEYVYLFRGIPYFGSSRTLVGCSSPSLTEPLRLASLGTSHSLRHRFAVPPPSKREARRGGKRVTFKGGSPGSPGRRGKDYVTFAAALAPLSGELSPTKSVTERLLSHKYPKKPIYAHMIRSRRHSAISNS